MALVLPVKRRLNPYDLRRLFNEGYYIHRITSQEFTARSVRCKPVEPDNPNIGPRIPIGSVTQTLQLLDVNDDFVAEFHRYIRPEGTIGASGYNDPKRIVINNVRFHQEQPAFPQPRLRNNEINQILRKRGLAAIAQQAITCSLSSRMGLVRFVKAPVFIFLLASDQMDRTYPLQRPYTPLSLIFS
jgi:hypothetical protein